MDGKEAMTRPELIQEWRADLLTLIAWAGGLVLAAFVLLALYALLYGALQGRLTTRRGKR